MNQQKTRSDTIRQAAIREGIRMERERVVRLLTSPPYRDLPCEDGAAVILNAIHWEPPCL